MSNSKEQRKRMVFCREKARCYSKFNYRLIEVSEVARVQIHATAAPEAKDTLVLRSSEGRAKSECSYWDERKVTQASPSDGFLNVSFARDGNEGTEERPLDRCSFTLIWRPGGKKNREVVLFEERPFKKVWKTGPDDTPKKIAELMPVRFQEAANVLLPDRSPEVLSGGDIPDEIREKKKDVPDAKTVGQTTAPVPDPESAHPMKERSGGGETPLPPGPRWITLLRRRGEAQVEWLATYKVTTGKTYKMGRFNGQGPASAEGGQKDVLLPLVEGVGDARTGVFARMSMVPPTRKRVEQQAARLDHTLTKTTEEGRQKGPGHSFVRLPLGRVLSADRRLPEVRQLKGPEQASGKGPGGTVYLPNPISAAQRRLTKAKEAHERFIAWKKRVAEAVGLTGLIGGTCCNKKLGRTYLRRGLKSSEGGTLAWGNNFLEERAFLGEKEQKGPFGTAAADYTLFGADVHDFERVMKKDAPPILPGTESAEVEEAIDELQTALGVENRLLGRVMYGHQCQWAFLTFRRDRALRATQGVVQSGLFDDLLRDVAVLPPKKDKGEIGPEMVRLVAHLSGMGDGETVTGMLAGILGAEEDEDVKGAWDVTVEAAADVVSETLWGDEESGEGDDEEENGEKEDASPESCHGVEVDMAHVLGGATTVAAVGAPTLVGLFKLAQRKEGMVKELAVNAAPAIAAVGARRNYTFAPEEVPSALVLLGAFLTASGSGNSFSVEMGTNRAGRPTLRVEGGSTATFVKRHVEGLEHRRAGEQTRWSVESVEGLSSVTVGSGGKAAGALEMAVAGVMIKERPKGGPSAKDLFGYAKMASDVIEVTGARAGGPAFTAGEAAWGLLEAMGGRWQGGQKTSRPAYWKVAGVVVKLATGETIGWATKKMPVVGFVVDKLVGKGVDKAINWAVKWGNLDEDAGDDPLITKDDKTGTWTRGWLAEKSQWGLRYEGSTENRDKLVKLVTPGGDKAKKAPSTKPIKEKAKAFTEKAFRFPTAVGVPPKPGSTREERILPGSPERFYLSIVPEYLPKARGTLMVDVGVQALDERGQTVGDEEPIPFSLHYVKMGGTLRYCVRLAEVGLQIPPEMALNEWAERRGWAQMETGIPASGRSSPKEYFPVHIGAWHQSLRSEQAKMRRESFSTVNEAMEALGLAGEAWEVPPQTVLPAGQVIPVLESGRFRVTGTVYFRPLKPFDPEPTVPSKEDVFAEENIDFRYS